MATNQQAAVFHQQQRAGKQKNDRKALEDIGNVVAARAPAVAEGKPQPRRKCAKPKAAIKPNPDVVIDISPDSVEESKQRRPSRKKAHSMTAVLAARSKAAIADIDAGDAGDQLAVVDYVDDIYRFYKLAEASSVPNDYMGSQPEINPKMRAILADWLIEVHSKFELMPESLYLAVNVIDRYLATTAVPRAELQLVGVAAMLIACKYEEIWAPEVGDFISISDRAYSRERVLAAEKEVLGALEWGLTVPTAYVFVSRFVKAAAGGREAEHMAFFFAELGLMRYELATCRPSMAAAAAVLAARCTLGERPVWPERLQRHTGFGEAELLDCVEVLVRSHEAAPEDRLKFVYRKYSRSEFGAVALRPPALRLLEELKAATEGSH